MNRAGEPAGKHRRRRAAAVLGVALVAAAGLPAASAGQQTSAPEAPVLLIVAGIGGTSEHRERFSGWARELCSAAVAAPGPVRVRILIERPSEQPDEADPCAPAGRSTRETIASEIASAASGAGGLVLILIGHGSGGTQARFQLPGPDLAPKRLAEMLDGVARGAVTVAHLGSASGAFLPDLSTPGRVFLAAARGNETNETRFPRHFVAAFTGADADGNKDGRLSAFEAFDFARRETEREYEREGLLPTEHALLDDNGDGVGSLEPELAAGSDGILAARRALLLRTPEAVAEAWTGGPELRRLVAERDALAARVDALRGVRANMEEEAYLTELEDLLLQIAALGERISGLREKPE